MFLWLGKDIALSFDLFVGGYLDENDTKLVKQAVKRSKLTVQQVYNTVLVQSVYYYAVDFLVGNLILIG